MQEDDEDEDDFEAMADEMEREDPIVEERKDSDQ